MAHWAEIVDNKVTQVVVGDNNDPAGDEGYQWLIDNLGGTWVKTSYNGKIRFNFAGIGFLYDPVEDAFIAPKPYESWVLNAKKQWEPPVAYPTDGKQYGWNEERGEWIETDSL
jgi:hypothetical protein